MRERECVCVYVCCVSIYIHMCVTYLFFTLVDTFIPHCCYQTIHFKLNKDHLSLSTVTQRMGVCVGFRVCAHVCACMHVRMSDSAREKDRDTRSQGVRPEQSIHAQTTTIKEQQI